MRRARGEETETTGDQGQAATPVNAETKGEDDMAYSESPRTRRTNPGERGYGGWDAIDSTAVDQYARMPMGLQTTEFIPNSLQEKWTGAWNTVHKMRDAAANEEE
jgi:hypothetical protein